MSYGFKIIVQGEYACFTRPEMKVERVSYDVPTPSALEGMLKSVYWKPAIKYVIDKIVVYNPIVFDNIRRNEVKDKVSFQKMKSCSQGNFKDPTVYTGEIRSQRASMILKNVKYGIEFHFELTGLKSEREDDDEKKHFNIIKRRIENGQFFRSPCLGCCEFPVKKMSLVEDFNEEEICVENRKKDVDLGFMLYGLNFADGGKPINGDWENPIFSDSAQAVYYRPHLDRGVIDVRKYREEIKC